MMEPSLLPSNDLTDQEISLKFSEYTPEVPEKGFVPAYIFNIIKDEKKVGEVKFKAGTNEHILFAGHFGYGIEPNSRGHHYAERAVRLLLPFAKKLGFKRIIITCNPANIASRRTCERLGAELKGIYPIPENHSMYQRGERDVCRYELPI